MSPNELIPADAVGEIQKYGNEAFNATSQASNYLPRLQLLIGSSKKCKAGDFPVNHFALIRGTNYTDMGGKLDVLLICWRPKALEIGDENITVYDMKLDDSTPPKPTGEYARIANRSDNEKDSGCMYGPEFLVWVPQIKEFATFFMGSVSGRLEAENFISKLRQPITLASDERKTKKYSWFTSIALDCSTPFEAPSMEAIKDVANRFNNPPESYVETVEEDGRER